MTGTLAALRALALGSVLVLAACEAENVVLFVGPDAGEMGGRFVRHFDGAPPDGGEFVGAPCGSEFDCPPSWFCDKRSCQSSTGVCEPRPTLCEQSPDPVCGCDQVTYWNDCLRMRNGVAASSSGQCRGQTHGCVTASDCGVVGASCNHLLPPGFPCGGPVPGTCWVTPQLCDPMSDPGRWVSCFGAPGPGSGPPPCLDTCSAIQSGAPFIPIPPGAHCTIPSSQFPSPP